MKMGLDEYEYTIIRKDECNKYGCDKRRDGKGNARACKEKERNGSEIYRRLRAGGGPIPPGEMHERAEEKQENGSASDRRLRAGGPVLPGERRERAKG